MKKKLLLLSAVSVPFIVFGFFLTIFNKKENNNDVTEAAFFQKAHADNPADWMFSGEGCQGAGGCCG